MSRSVTYDVADHQEIIRESLPADDAELQIQPLLQLGRDGWITPAGSFQRQCPKLIEGSCRIGRPGRNRAVSDRYDVAAPLGDVLGRGQCLGIVGKMTGQFGNGAEPGSLRPELGWGKGGEGGVERDGSKQAVATPVLGIRGHHPVGCHHWQAQSAGSRHGLVALAARAQLGVEIVRATQTQRLFQKRDAAREQNKSLAIVSYGLNESVALRPDGRTCTVGSRLTTAPPIPLRALLHQYVHPCFAGSIVPMNAGYCSAEC